MATTKFLTTRVTFNGNDSSTLTASASQEFETDVSDVTVATQSWKITTSSDREIRHFELGIDNVQKNGPKVSCDIILTLASSETKWTLEHGNCYVDIIFLAVCD